MASWSAHSAFFIIACFMSCSGWKCVSNTTLELVVVGSCIVFCVTIHSFDTWYAGKIAGLNHVEDLMPLRKGHQGYSDIRVLLTTVNLHMCAHVLLPVRWIFLVPAEICHVSFYAFIVAAGVSPETGINAVMNVILLTAVMIMMSAGKHSMEKHERMEAVRLINEKVLRFQSEFRLENGKPSSKPTCHVCDSEKSLGRSCASTTLSGRVFSDLDAWESIASLGVEEHWLVPASEITMSFDETLGQGGFGEVILATYHGADVAIKFPWKADLVEYSERHIVSVLHEIRILRHLRHPCIIGLIGALVDIEKGLVGLILEREHGESLDRFVRCDLGPPKTSIDARKEIVLSIGHGLQYLHSRCPCVVHGDLKDTNILVSEVGTKCTRRVYRSKLIDFGLSRMLTRNVRPLGGTPLWAAPEVILGGQLPSAAADVFSFGKVVFLIGTNLDPNVCWAREEIRNAISQRWTLPLDWPEEDDMVSDLKAIIELCLQASPPHRPAIRDVLQEMIDQTQFLDALEAYAQEEMAMLNKGTLQL
eukprot:TRINITY_DN6728_c0_g1_i7.p1 TRINITY_DN6728_c0_g1~~TRINITY_DN6728_c0_g1_i7.p1  ORF type:complete len:614 (+),score=54.74 TRINITY_DN6728_c0_g1_i7:246-1844(+)